MRSRLRRTLLDPLEGLLAHSLMVCIGLLPKGLASDFGGWLGRLIGPRLGVHRVAARNLAMALPHLTPAAQEVILRDMWDNLGRTLFELPRLDSVATDGRLEWSGKAYLEQAVTGDRAALLVSGHLGNWEVCPRAARSFGNPVDVVYRAPNNPHVASLFTRGTGPGMGTMIPKGPAGARILLESLRAKNKIGLLIDQKMNDGMPVPLFGIAAMTAPAPAQLALRFDAVVVPARVQRLADRRRFRMAAYPPLDLPRTGDRDADVRALLLTLNGLLEDWIREDPAQWLWVHRRWPKEAWSAHPPPPADPA